MELKLNYNEQVSRKVSAAFIRGTSVSAWLREINSWEIAPDNLTCYIMPESVRSISAAGLFVIFNEEKIPEIHKLKSPYSLLGGKLFIPLHSELQPETTNSELKTLLLWDCYVFHPSIGLVGFGMNNKTDLLDLLNYESPCEVNWGNAHHGNPALPGLNEIRIQNKMAEEILDSLKESVGTKPLTEIPEKESDKKTPAKKIAGTLGRGLLKGGLFIAGIIGSVAGAGATSGSGNSSGGGKGSSSSTGLFKRFHAWMNKTLEELEKERDTELRRLLNMFDHDTAEALAYAIPLNSPYLNRGEASASSRLGRRNTNFNLSGLGGGGRVDSWNASRYYADLRNKYQLAAKKEIDAGNYKRAAYVHAHLLGDFSSAANVLMQGKLYREAAALYKDHLKNIPAAAECLENGGLLLEAIKLYQSLGKNEKAGDLYKKLGQNENAEKFFNHCVELSLKNDDYLEAARVIDQKLESPVKAKATLLEGWEKSGQAETCLSRYFELKTEDETHSLTNEIKAIYTNHTPKTKRTSFLNVLVPVFSKNNDKEVRELTRNIAYEIASEQALSGNPAGIQMLRNFLPGDRLISSDSSRFIYRSKSLTKFNAPVASYDLLPDKNNEMKWLTAITWRNQFIVIGKKEAKFNPCVGLVRGNWEEFWGSKKELMPEYLTWNEKMLLPLSATLIADAYYTNLAILYTGTQLQLSAKTLTTTSQFDQQIFIGRPQWLPINLIAAAVCGPHKLAVLYTENNLTQLAFYNMSNGDLINSFGCLNEKREPIRIQPLESLAEMIFRDNVLYFGFGAYLIRCSVTGDIEATALNARILSLTASDHGAELRIVVATEQGCLLIRPDFSGVHIASGFINPDVDMDKVKYIPDNKVVTAGGKRAIVYDILLDDLRKRCSIETENNIVSILPTSRKNFCALLEVTGKISIHDIENV